jgi:glycosyltransferase involved in cell wall biosynthesis
MAAKLRVLFLIEDGSFQYDNRVRREAATLRDAGAQVAVISPKSPGEPWHSTVDGIGVYRYWKPSIGSGFAAHVLEYLVSLLAQSTLSAWVFARHGFDAIHAANPPDLLWLVALPYRLLGRRFVFDHHDLVPELYEDRFGRSQGLVLATMRLLERASLRLADHVISTNATYRQVAIERGAKQPDEVTVVRNGPDFRDFPDGPHDERVRALGRIVVGYLGNMNPQDGVDQFVEMARVIRCEQKREDIGFVMIGKGDSFEDLKRLRDSLGLGGAILMTGRVPWSNVVACLRATDICVQPDPPGRLNDLSTMNKLMEYMAVGRAVVAYDLAETRVSGGDAAVYVEGASVGALVEAVLRLADSPEELRTRQAAGRRRVDEVLAWTHQARHLLGVYQRMFPDRLLGEVQAAQTSPHEIGA